MNSLTDVLILASVVFLGLGTDLALFRHDQIAIQFFLIGYGLAGVVACNFVYEWTVDNQFSLVPIVALVMVALILLFTIATDIFFIKPLKTKPKL